MNTMYVLCIINNVYHSVFCSRVSYDVEKVEKNVQRKVLKCIRLIVALKKTCDDARDSKENCPSFQKLFSKPDGL